TSVPPTPVVAAGWRGGASQAGRALPHLNGAAVPTIAARAPERRFHSRGLGSGAAYSRPDPDAVEARLRGR
ncbi:MAG: hypothetical protein ACT4PP_12255, partial [Sporichthyaceae bacterium]